MISAQTLSGDWQGTLDVHGTSVPLVLHIRQDAKGIHATLDSPTQGVAGLAVDEIDVTGATKTFSISSIPAQFTVEAASDSTLSGTWRQGSAAIPLSLSRAALSSIPTSRPQTPKPPFPYRSIEVAFDNPDGGSHLAGTLTVPNKTSRAPAVLLITGSGLQDRDETMFGHHPFLIWADALSRRGIAVLRLDDRQVGGSRGDVAKARTPDFASDAAAAIKFLRGQRLIDGERIGIIGHSEGAVVGTLVANQDHAIRFVVLLAGPSLSGERVLLDQKRTLETAAGLPRNVVDASNDNMRRIYDAVKGAPDQSSADAALDAVWKVIVRNPAAQVPASIRPVTRPWMRWFVSYDPTDDLAHLRCPVLAVFGSKDTEVDAASNAAAMRAALKSNPTAAVFEIQGINHLMQDALTGSPEEYPKISETVSPRVLDLVSKWIVSAFQKGASSATRSTSSVSADLGAR